jgi:dTDP-4-amino-4,6-dideoxygalactose transaminase
MKILFSNPRKQNIFFKKKIIKILKKAIVQEKYILSKHNSIFEKKLKSYFNIKYSLNVKNGTDALKIALMSLDLKKNDEIIIPSFTATATGSAVIEAGGKPVFIDVDVTGNLDSNLIKKFITKKTKAIIVVHLHGNVANILKIKKIVGSKIKILEDCAQSFGSMLNNQKVGTLGDIGCLSFYPTKNLAAIGDGGAIITSNKKLYKKMLAIRQYGWNKNRISVINGCNSRMDEIQASILSMKINYIDKNNLKRNIIAKKYFNAFRKLSISYPNQLKKIYHSYHLFVIFTKKRDKLIKYLKSKNISSSIHYKYPLHKMPTFKNYKKSKMNLTNNYSKNILSLPIFPELKTSEQNYVIKNVKDFFFKKNAR